MDVRITPYSTQSTLVAPRKTNAKTSSYFSRDRTQFEISKRTSPSIQAKKSRSINNNSILILSKKNTSRPQFSIRITSSVVQPAAVSDKKGGIALSANRKE